MSGSTRHFRRRQLQRVGRVGSWLVPAAGIYLYFDEGVALLVSLRALVPLFGVLVQCITWTPVNHYVKPNVLAVRRLLRSRRATAFSCVILANVYLAAICAKLAEARGAGLAMAGYVFLVSWIPYIVYDLLSFLLSFFPRHFNTLVLRKFSTDSAQEFDSMLAILSIYSTVTCISDKTLNKRVDMWNDYLLSITSGASFETAEMWYMRFLSDIANYASDGLDYEEWHKYISDRMKEADLVVIDLRILEITKNILWEIEEATSTLGDNRMVILLPPNCTPSSTKVRDILLIPASLTRDNKERLIRARSVSIGSEGELSRQIHLIMEDLAST